MGLEASVGSGGLPLPHQARSLGRGDMAVTSGSRSGDRGPRRSLVVRCGATCGPLLPALTVGQDLKLGTRHPLPTDPASPAASPRPKPQASEHFRGRQGGVPPRPC